jgi:hypothetical protein
VAERHGIVPVVVITGHDSCSAVSGRLALPSLPNLGKAFVTSN